MDVDWCLSCERKLDDLPGPYCSPECLAYAQPCSSLRVLSLPRPASPAYRIRQWAQAIPPHIPAGAPSLPFSDLVLLPSPSPASERPPSPRPRLQPTPKLIERTAASTPLPTLCVSSPAHVRPPLPARARSYSRPTNTTACMSEASTSLTSLLTEPMVATPDEDVSFGANIGALVRSWVHCDRPNSTKCPREDIVIEKVTDYFPPLPPAKKSVFPPVSAKKSKRPPPPTPAPASRHTLLAKKAASPLDRDRTTPHTPTPVIFPSCRAAELDWAEGDNDDDDDDDDDQFFVDPQPQHHPSCHHKHASVHWTRAPSLSSSVSSSASSVLLMAPKCHGGTRTIAT